MIEQLFFLIRHAAETKEMSSELILEHFVQSDKRITRSGLI